jgi:hypothetical protein
MIHLIHLLHPRMDHNTHIVANIAMGLKPIAIEYPITNITRIVIPN